VTLLHVWLEFCTCTHTTIPFVRSLSLFPAHFAFAILRFFTLSCLTTFTPLSLHLLLPLRCAPDGMNESGIGECGQWTAAVIVAVSGGGRRKCHGRRRRKMNDTYALPRITGSLYLPRYQQTAYNILSLRHPLLTIARKTAARALALTLQHCNATITLTSHTRTSALRIGFAASRALTLAPQLFALRVCGSLRSRDPPVHHHFTPWFLSLCHFAAPRCLITCRSFSGFTSAAA